MKSTHANDQIIAPRRSATTLALQPQTDAALAKHENPRSALSALWSLPATVANGRYLSNSASSDFRG